MIVLRWSLGRHRVVPTKKEGARLQKVWKRWKERQGWRVSGNATNGYRAYPPGFVNDGVIDNQVGVVHAVSVRELPDRV